jgi:hypothetical protein
MPWALVAVLVLAVLAGLAFFTLYLPARQAAIAGNTVHVQDLTVRLTAQPNAAHPHGVDLDLAVEPPLAAGAAVDVTPTMPAMGNMTARLSGLTSTAPGAYRASADLGMGGLWQVRVTIRRPGQPDAVAHFRLNA